MVISRIRRTVISVRRLYLRLRTRRPHIHLPIFFDGRRVNSILALESRAGASSGAGACACAGARARICRLVVVELRRRRRILAGRVLPARLPRAQRLPAAGRAPARLRVGRTDAPVHAAVRRRLRSGRRLPAHLLPRDISQRQRGSAAAAVTLGVRIFPPQ